MSVLASASVHRLRVGLVWRGSVVPVSMRSLGTDRSLGKFPPAGRLNIHSRQANNGHCGAEVSRPPRRQANHEGFPS